MKWAAEKKEFIAISLNVTTLSEARQKMNDYMVWIVIYIVKQLKI